MNFEEFAAKPILADAGIRVPKSILCETTDEVARAAREIGRCVVKAQVPVGKRGKAGGIQLANSVNEAKNHAQNIIGMKINGYVVDKVLVEAQSNIIREFYAAILNDPATQAPLVMFSTEGGMDIEEIAASRPDKIKQAKIDVRRGLSLTQAFGLVEDLELSGANEEVANVLIKLYSAYRKNDAELLEINPLVLNGSSILEALDCKFVLDDSAVKRQPEIVATGTPEKLTELEKRGEQHGIKYVELNGNVVVLANGAGLTMTTMDVVRHYGGEPANFCEIGGEAYTKGRAALELVLAKPGIKSLVVNFCGAFARCDVMMEGILEAWVSLNPKIPVFFSVAGTGDEEAIIMLKKTLSLDPLPNMDEACKAAVKAAEGR